MRVFADDRCVLKYNRPWVTKEPALLALEKASVGVRLAEQVRICPRDLPLFKEELFYPGDVTIVLPLGLKESIFAFSINTPGMTAIRYWDLRRDYGKVLMEERFFQVSPVELVG